MKRNSGAIEETLPLFYNAECVFAAGAEKILDSNLINKKGKAVPLQARKCPEGSRNLRLPDFMTTAQDVGKVVSLTHRPPLPPGNTPGTHFC